MSFSSSNLLKLICLGSTALLCLSQLSLIEAKKKHHRHRGHHWHRSRTGCPRGWTDHDSSCYKHFSSALSWIEAAGSCAAHGAHLVAINSAKEADWLCTRLSLLSLTHWSLCRAWWTAGRSDDGTWLWYQTHSVYEIPIQSDKWFGGRPDAGLLEDHGVTMQLSGGYIGLIARDLDIRLPYVCEIDVEDSGSVDSDSSTESTRGHSRGSSSSGGSHAQGHHSRSSGSDGHHSRSSGSDGHHSRSSGSHGHHSRSSGSHGHHSRGSRGRHSYGPERHSYGPGHHRRNPYSPYCPKPSMPRHCTQLETTVAPTTTTQQPTTREDPTTTSTKRPITTEPPTTATSVAPTTDHNNCPPGWHSFSSSCYQIHNSCAQTRYVARTACELVGGHLVGVDTPEEEAFLTAQLGRARDWWISGRYEDGDWSFPDHSVTSSSSGDYDYLFVISGTGSSSDEEYTNWHENEPSRAEDGSFAVLSFSNGRWGWKSRRGQEYKHFICEVRGDRVQYGCLTNACQYSAQSITLNSWERFLDHEYLVYDSCAKSLPEAAEACKTKGSELLSIKSSAEMRFVAGLLRTRSYDVDDAPNWWTNGVKIQGKWRWENSSKKLIYTNWGPHLTDVPTGNHIILHYYPHYDDWMWADTNETQDLPFICKRAI